jgi:hypothetical protein
MFIRRLGCSADVFLPTGGDFEVFNKTEIQAENPCPDLRAAAAINYL